MRRMRTLLLLLSTLAVAVLVPAAPASSPPKLDRAVAEWRAHPARSSVRVLIRTRPGRAVAVLGRLMRTVGPSVMPSSSADLLVARLSPDSLRAVERDPDVTRISTDAPVASLAIEKPQSSLIDRAASLASFDQSHLLATLGLVAVQDGKFVRAVPYTGNNVGVAVIDSGLDQNYADLNAVTFYNAVGNIIQTPRSDGYGHGTHVSGLTGSNALASRGDYQGVAPAVRFIEMRVLDKNGNGYTSDVINAINYVVRNKKTLGLGVINLSLGHPIYEPAAFDPLVQAVEAAVREGIVVVVAAGNFGGDPIAHVPGYAGITSPGNAPSAITVGAVETYQTNTRSDDVVAWFSSRGPTWYDGFQKPDIVAPGSHLVSNISPSSTIYQMYPGGRITAGLMPYFKLSGTSMSAPVVSGIVATMLEASTRNGAPLTPNAIKAILQFTAIPLPDHDVLTQGAGEVNGAGAIVLAAAINPLTTVGSWWLATGVSPYTVIAGETLSWGQRLVWSDRVVWGNQVYTNDPAWATTVV